MIHNATTNTFCRKDSRGTQLAKEMLSSDQTNLYKNPLKSETNDSSTLERVYVPIQNDIPASTMISFLSQLTLVPTSIFSLFHVPSNATSTTTRLRIHNNSHQTSLNEATTAHVSATTAIMTVTMTQVPATATTNTPIYQLDKCKATRVQNKTRSPSILHPIKKAANYATPRNLLLFFILNDSAITIWSL